MGMRYAAEQVASHAFTAFARLCIDLAHLLARDLLAGQVPLHDHIPDHKRPGIRNGGLGDDPPDGDQALHKGMN